MKYYISHIKNVTSDSIFAANLTPKIHKTKLIVLQILNIELKFV